MCNLIHTTTWLEWHHYQKPKLSNPLPAVVEQHPHSWTFLSLQIDPCPFALRGPSYPCPISASWSPHWMCRCQRWRWLLKNPVQRSKEPLNHKIFSVNETAVDWRGKIDCSHSRQLRSITITSHKQGSAAWLDSCAYRSLSHEWYAPHESPTSSDTLGRPFLLSL